MIVVTKDEVGTILDQTVVLDERFMKIIRRTVKTTGGTREQLIWDRSGKKSVITVAITRNNEIVFVNEPKFGIFENIFGLPAGAVDPGESAVQAAKRELLEETGYVSERWFLLRADIIDFPDKIDGGEHYFFLALDAKSQEILTEDNEVILIPVKETAQLLLGKGEYTLKTAMSISCLAIALCNLKKAKKALSRT